MKYLLYAAPWNLFLAFIPVALGVMLGAGVRRARSWGWIWLLVPLALLWLAFLPNSSYLVTGWRHLLSYLEHQEVVLSLREDRRELLRTLAVTGLYLIYCGLGPVSFTLAVRPLERALRERRAPVNLLTPLFFLLVAHGVYLGLVVRFNSWDLATRPGTVFATSWDALARPELNALTVGFAVFLWLTYLAVDIWLDGLMVRGRRWAEAIRAYSPSSRSTVLTTVPSSKPDSR